MAGQADDLREALRSLEQVQEANHDFAQLADVVVAVRALEQLAADEIHHLVDCDLQLEDVL